MRILITIVRRLGGLICPDPKTLLRTYGFCLADRRKQYRLLFAEQETAKLVLTSYSKRK